MLTLFFSLAMAWATQAGALGSTGSYSIQETYRNAEIILLGEISGGRAVDVGDKVQCRVAVRADRVIKGGIAPGADVNLAWEYVPSMHEPPEATSRVPRAYGLWMIRSNAEGGFLPLRVGHTPGTMGGYFLPLPRLQLPSGFEYGAVDSPDAKLARELGAVLEQFAVKAGEGLNQTRVTGPAGGYAAHRTPVQAAFQEVSSFLSLTDAAAARPIYKRFADSELANLRVIGVAGLLRGGDVNAVSLIEQNAAQFSSALEAIPLASSLGGLDLKKYPEAMHSLARAALGENEIPTLENTAAMKLGWSGRWDMMPYLVVMLESPNASTRGSALMGVCTAVRALGGQSELAGQWHEEMSPHCFNRSPVNDPPREQAAVSFWKSWWAGQRERLRDVTLPSVHPPARYSAAPAADAPQAVEVSMEQRFRSHIRMTTAMNRHRAEQGNVPGAPASPDDALMAATVQRVSEQLEEVDQRARRILNEARLARQRPDIEQMRDLQAESDAILRQGLDDLRRGLSVPAWTAFEQRLKSMAISGFRLPTPAPGAPRPRQ